jgi:hypothetical protein
MVFTLLAVLTPGLALRGVAPPLLQFTRPSLPHRTAPCLLSSLQELPSNSLIKALEQSGGIVTASDAAAQSGQEIGETRRQLLVLARLVGGELQVSNEGELTFVFEQSLRRSLAAASVRQRAKDTWTTVSPPLYWVLRASFGVALLTSLTIVVAGITALQASKDDNSRSSASMLLSFWGPSPLDFLYYSRRPCYYQDMREMGFLQSCFSFLFGDADPNADFEQRMSRAVASLVRANGGAVTAEQLAPLLLPQLTPEEV